MDNDEATGIPHASLFISRGLEVAGMKNEALSGWLFRFTRNNFLLSRP